MLLRRQSLAAMVHHAVTRQSWHPPFFPFLQESVQKCAKKRTVLRTRTRRAGR